MLRALDDLVRQGKVRYYRLFQLSGVAFDGGVVDFGRERVGSL